MTKPYGGLATADSMSVEVKSALRMLGIRPGNRDVQWTSFHFTTKSGPMGPALRSAIYELPSILSNLQLLADIRLVGGERLASILDSLGQVSKAISIVRSPVLSRLAIFGDKELKTRIVAIVDYWSQTCLYPTHQMLMRLLKKIPTDCTFDQGKFQSLSRLPGPFYSFDLTAVTDRMPL